MSRPVLLLTLGADPLPNTTPVVPVSATWVPAIYVPPPVPVPGGFAASPVMDAVLLTWTAIAGDALFAIERAADVAGAPGAWAEIARTTDLRYTAAVANGTTYWWRMKAVVFGRTSATTAQLKATPVTIAGKGVNLLDDRYSTFEAATLPPFVNPTSIVLGRDAGTKIVSAALTVASAGTVYLGDAMRLALTPGKKYIVSAWARSPTNNHGFRFAIEALGGVYYFGAPAAALTPANTWQRVSALIDLTANTQTVGWLLVENNSAGTLHLDGLMVEEAVADYNKPSAYARGTASGVALSALANALDARAIADGKVDVIYAGVMPNPALYSYGDFWQRQTDGRWFVHNGTTFVESPDNRIPQAITDAANANSAAGAAQTTANGKIRLFVFPSTTPPVGPFTASDQWYVTDLQVTRYWNGIGWSLLATINTALNGGKNLVPNGTFAARLKGNLYAASGVGNVIVDNWKVRQVDPQWSMVLDGNFILFRINSAATLAGGATAYGIIDGDKFAVSAGQSVRTTARFENAWLSTPANANTMVRTYTVFYDAAGTYISDTSFDVQRAGGFGGVDITAPTGTAYAMVSIAGFFYTNGSAVVCGSLPFDARLALVTCVLRNDLDTEVDHGTTYGKTANTDLFDSGGVRRVGLRINGSGQRIGDQRNLPQSNTTAYGSVRSATALTATSAGAVSVNAHSVRYGGISVAYNAVGNAVTGLTVGVTYVIYCFDDAYAGGTRTWYAGTNPDAVMQIGDGVVVAGQITIPAAGSSGGGGGGDGAPADWCVDWDCVLPDGRLVRELVPGELAPCWAGSADAPRVEMVPLRAIAFGEETSYTLVCNSGRITQSQSTPMDTRDGRVVRTADMLGEDVLTFDGLRWEPVREVIPVGVRRVVKPDFGDRMFFAGDTANSAIATHNAIMKP